MQRLYQLSTLFVVVHPPGDDTRILHLIGNLQRWVGRHLAGFHVGLTGCVDASDLYERMRARSSAILLLGLLARTPVDVGHFPIPLFFDDGLVSLVLYLMLPVKCNVRHLSAERGSCDMLFPRENGPAEDVLLERVAFFVGLDHCRRQAKLTEELIRLSSCHVELVEHTVHPTEAVQGNIGFLRMPDGTLDLPIDDVLFHPHAGVADVALIKEGFIQDVVEGGPLIGSVQVLLDLLQPRPGLFVFLQTSVHHHELEPRHTLGHQMTLHTIRPDPVSRDG